MNNVKMEMEDIIFSILERPNYKSIKKYLSKFKPKYLVHTAALSRPMDIHNKNLVSSIETNIVGTCNVVRACSERNIKLIYFSSNSQPTPTLLFLTAASIAEPTPEKGSKTTSFSLVKAKMHLSTNSIGN